MIFQVNARRFFLIQHLKVNIDFPYFALCEFTLRSDSTIFFQGEGVFKLVSRNFYAIV